MESKHWSHLLAREDARSVSVIIVSMILFLLSGPVLVKGQGGVYLFGDNVTLQCVSNTQSEDEQFIWRDTSNNIAIYSVTGPDVNTKTPNAMVNEKYENFGLDNNYPNDVNLLINLLDVIDAGSYRCNFILQDSPAALTVDVEAIPISVSISCERSSSTVCPLPSSSTSDAFRCNCIAFGAFPKDLEFEWSVSATDVKTSQLNNTERAGSFDIYTNAEIVLTENPGSVSCTLTGYSKNWEGDRNAVYNFNPPMCALQTTCIKSGNAVRLTCTCSGASPAEGLVYSFFRDGELLTSGVTNVFEADIEVDQEYIFECRGCNGLNYGNSSNDTELVMCQRTTESTTEELKPTPTNEPDPFPIWVIILIIVVVLAVVIAVIAVIMYKKGKDDSKPQNSSVADGNVTATNSNITSSEPPAPVYGVVKKDSKKKSDKPDDNGAGPAVVTEPPTYGKIDKNRTKDPTPAPRSSMRDSTNPSKPKQDGPMEMQYADLDHGNKPPSDEVRKPTEEPTEYATVQSVIV